MNRSQALDEQRKDDAELQRAGWDAEPTDAERQQQELALRGRRVARLAVLRHRQARQEVQARREHTGEFLDRVAKEKDYEDYEPERS